jgi:thioredoxin-like negative regulator of GroEL
MPATRERQPATAAHDANEADSRPKLLFFYTDRSGRSRRAEGYLAQVLQRRRNHDTFQLYRVECDERPALARRFGIENPPVLVVIENKRIQARLEQPRGGLEIQNALATWLR